MDKILWWAGYKGEERPRKIIFNGKEYFVDSVLETKLIEDLFSSHRVREIICKSGKNIFKIIEEIVGWRVEKL